MTISFQKLSKRGKGKRRSRFPEGMTERKARAKTRAGRRTVGGGELYDSFT
jgi:hypothetical protein